jgi:hypothetical protein
MIKFSLTCAQSHEFEGWFSSGDEFERLSAGGHLECPVCGGGRIKKMLMAPAVKTTRGSEQKVIPFAGENVLNQSADGSGQMVDQGELQAANSVRGTTGKTSLEAGKHVMPSLPAEVHAEIANQLREIKKKVMASAENVGDRFGSEARKIHYGESKKRGIYGQASPQEAVELLNEGIDIIALPTLPEEQN